MWKFSSDDVEKCWKEIFPHPTILISQVTENLKLFLVFSNFRPWIRLFFLILYSAEWKVAGFPEKQQTKTLMKTPLMFNF